MVRLGKTKQGPSQNKQIFYVLMLIYAHMIWAKNHLKFTKRGNFSLDHNQYINELEICSGA